MTRIELPEDEKKQLLSYNLAINGWKSALLVLEQIRTLGLRPDTGLFEGFLTGACALYARPFKKGAGLVKRKCPTGVLVVG